MTSQPTQPAHDSLARHPDWQVQSVFDPDRGGKDFAYTIGLHDRGLPELHLWARPDRGEDPGHDWVLSMRDRALILNELAWRLIDGTVSVGSELTRAYDDGLAVVHLRLEPPGDRDVLEAFGIAPDAEVLPVSWSLSRPAEGPLVGVGPEQETLLRADLRDLVEGLDPSRPGPLGWEMSVEPSFDPGQRFGPLTPLVMARAAQLWQGDAEQLAQLLADAVTVEAGGGSLTFPVSVATTAARPVGRSRACEELNRGVQELVEWLTEHHSNRWRWRRVLEELFGEEELIGKVRTRHRQAASLLHDAVRAGLLVEAVADVMPEEWLVHGRGPWVSAFQSAPGELPGPAWAASPEVIDVVLGVLRPLSQDALLDVAVRHLLAGQGCGVGGERFYDVVMRLRSRSLTGPAGCPWAGALSTLPAWGAFDEPPRVLLQEWATCMTAALTHRLWLSDDDVLELALPFADLLPDLGEILDSPVVGSCESDADHI